MTTQNYLNSIHANSTLVQVNDLNIFKTTNNVNQTVFQIWDNDNNMLDFRMSKKAAVNFIKKHS